MEYLVETALLTHGLQSISPDQLGVHLQSAGSHLLWLEQGHVRCGTVEEYLPFRQNKQSSLRINCHMVEQAVREQCSGAFTASGTMAVCQKEQIPLAITCGIGGLDRKTTPEQCPDLFALTKLPVTLLATSPKDTVDIAKTLTWLQEQGVEILGRQKASCTGYLFCQEEVPLNGVYQHQPLHGKSLLLNEIEPAKRLQEKRLLEEAIQSGYEAVAQGQYFHPAVNGSLDLQSQGYSSRLQLEALVNNILWAQTLT